MGTLTDKAIRTLKPGKHSDGHGLTLLVTDTGKLWRYRFQFLIDGKRKAQELPIGKWPVVLGEEARSRCLDARRKVDKGINPCAEKRAAKQAAKAESAGLFQAVCELWLDRFYPARDANRQRIESWLGTYFYPSLAKRPMSRIENTDVNTCLDGLVLAGKLDTAHRAFRVLAKVWPWAVGRGLAARDSMLDLAGQLPPPIRDKFPGLIDPLEVGQLLRAIDAYPSRKPQVRICMQLMPYFALRPSELREATWAEFDLPNAVWHIPAKRMKVGKKVRPPHAVPIPTQALALLRTLSLLSETVEVPHEIEAQILTLRAQGHGKNKIARLVGVGDATVQKLLKDSPPLPAGKVYNQWTKDNPHPTVPLDYHNVEHITALRQPTGYLFPSREHRNVLSVNQPFSDATVNKALRALGYCTNNKCTCEKLHHTGHGWRTTFSTLMTDELGEDFFAIERSLAHGTPGVAGDYKEATMLKARRPMMQRWADYLDKLRTLPVDSQRRPATHADMNSSMSDSSQRTAESATL